MLSRCAVSLALVPASLITAKRQAAATGAGRSGPQPAEARHVGQDPVHLRGGDDFGRGDISRQGKEFVSLVSKRSEPADIRLQLHCRGEPNCFGNAASSVMACSAAKTGGADIGSYYSWHLAVDLRGQVQIRRTRRTQGMEARGRYRSGIQEGKGRGEWLQTARDEAHIRLWIFFPSSLRFRRRRSELSQTCQIPNPLSMSNQIRSHSTRRRRTLSCPPRRLSPSSHDSRGTPMPHTSRRSEVWCRPLRRFRYGCTVSSLRLDGTRRWRSCSILCISLCSLYLPLQREF